MLLRVDPDEPQAQLLSLPPDLLVSFPGRGRRQDQLGPGRGRPGGPDRHDPGHLRRPDPPLPPGRLPRLQGAGAGHRRRAVLLRTPCGTRRPACSSATGAATRWGRTRRWPTPGPGTSRPSQNGEWVTDCTADLGRISRQQDFIRRAIARTVTEGVANPLLPRGRVRRGHRRRADGQRPGRRRLRAAGPQVPRVQRLDAADPDAGRDQRQRERVVHPPAAGHRGQRPPHRHLPGPGRGRGRPGARRSASWSTTAPVPTARPAKRPRASTGWGSTPRRVPATPRTATSATASSATDRRQRGRGPLRGRPDRGWGRRRAGRQHPAGADVEVVTGADFDGISSDLQPPPQPLGGGGAGGAGGGTGPSARSPASTPRNAPPADQSGHAPRRRPRLPLPTAASDDLQQSCFASTPQRCFRLRDLSPASGQARRGRGWPWRCGRAWPRRGREPGR